MSRQSSLQLEVVCFDVRGALAAAAGAADRIELCANPAEGGTTPSYGLIQFLQQTISVPLMVMIRPRGGDFLYNDAEAEIMRRDIRACKELGVQGIVFGALTGKGNVNTTLCKELAELASPLPCTFHRAFDMVQDPQAALEDIITCGFTRVLTSGGMQRAAEGIGQLKKLHAQANNRIIILPGGGVDESCIGQLVNETGLREFHISARMHVPSAMEYRNPNVKMGTGGEEYQLLTVSIDRIKKIRKLAEENLRLTSYD